MDFGAWLAETYGQDLSGVTEIKGVPSDVTGAFLFFRIRSKEKRLSFFLFFTDDAIEVVLAETTNANLLTPLPLCPLLPPGSLEPLANCTALVTLDLEECTKIEGSCPRVRARAPRLEIANLKP